MCLLVLFGAGSLQAFFLIGVLEKRFSSPFTKLDLPGLRVCQAVIELTEQLAIERLLELVDTLVFLQGTL